MENVKHMPLGNTTCSRFKTISEESTNKQTKAKFKLVKLNLFRPKVFLYECQNVILQKYTLKFQLN